MHSPIFGRGALGLLLSLLPLALPTQAAPARIHVAAGEFDRQDALVTFSLPATSPRFDAIRLHDRLLPLQVDTNGHATFVLPDLKSGQSIDGLLLLQSNRAAPLREPFRLQRTASKLSFQQTGQRMGEGRPLPPLLEYQAEPGPFPRPDIKPVFERGAYLHPIHTLAGRLVTDDFPPNHIHHHGVWWSWTHTKFQGREPDFWNMGDGKGRVDFVALDESWSGPIHAGFRSRHQYLDLTTPARTVALRETWEVTVFAPPRAGAAYWMFDLHCEEECATADALQLPLYRYGGVGIRGNRAWNGARETSFLTSDGESDREKGNASRGRWCDMAGDVEGARVGIAILGHPENFRAPEPMRLHPTEPFFCFAPQEAGDMALEPGQHYRWRYRFVVHDGPLSKTELDRLWNDFAHPPHAEFTSTSP